MIIDTRPTASTSTVRSATRVAAVRAIIRGAELVEVFEAAAVLVDAAVSEAAGSLVPVDASADDEADSAFGAGVTVFCPPSRL